MDNIVNSAIEHLERLVAFETVSGRSNLDFTGYVADHLQRHGLPVFISTDSAGKRANIHSYCGPPVNGGVVLNGHSDVVPVAGQHWSGNPFVLTRRKDRLYGRGSADMKGFIACMLAAVPLWLNKHLARPLHISVCYDEETGGFGAPGLVADMAVYGPAPAIAIIGEPTLMQIVNAHKGGLELRTTITGLEAHSCDPRKGASAISCAARLVSHIYEVADRLASRPYPDSPFDPAWTTINVGKVSGGVSSNTVAGSCQIDWEMRPMPSDDGEQILAGIKDFCRKILEPEMRRQSKSARISTSILANVPALAPGQARAAVEFAAGITGHNSTGAVSFGTDAGHFAKQGMSTIVLGPGSIEQAHKPDEYISIAQVRACLDFFDRLSDKLAE